jgi:hypothetical protein
MAQENEDGRVDGSGTPPWKSVHVAIPRAPGSGAAAHWHSPSRSQLAHRLFRFSDARMFAVGLLQRTALHAAYIDHFPTISPVQSLRPSF